MCADFVPTWRSIGLYLQNLSFHDQEIMKNRIRKTENPSPKSSSRTSDNDRDFVPRSSSLVGRIKTTSKRCHIAVPISDLQLS